MKHISLAYDTATAQPGLPPLAIATDFGFVDDPMCGARFRLWMDPPPHSILREAQLILDIPAHWVTEAREFNSMVELMASMAPESGNRAVD